MNKSPRQLAKWSQRLLAVVGCLTLLYVAGAVCLRWMRNSSPGSHIDIASPDKVHRMVILDMLVGFPGQTCIKEVYVLRAKDELERGDDDSRVYTGACNGLRNIHWVGSNIEADTDLVAAGEDVRYFTLRNRAGAGTVVLRLHAVAPSLSAGELAVARAHLSR
ncbi:MAG: hypothetical protein JWP59_4265 [Massilia sp.]|nr:hypothetical protein [Massilia sp.]